MKGALNLTVCALWIWGSFLAMREAVTALKFVAFLLMLCLGLVAFVLNLF